MSRLLLLYLFILIVVFLLTITMLKILRPFACHLKLIDHPGGRKHHHNPTPLIGGIAMFIAFSFGSLGLPVSLQHFRAFFAAALLLVLIGVLDDFNELTPRFRLLVQILAGLIMVLWGEVTLHSLGNLIFTLNIHLNYGVGLIISVCAVIGIINAINMLDGVDGLVGTITLLQFLCLIYLAFINGYLANIIIIVLFVPILLGFLCFNFPFPGRKHALVFMGDAGSMFLGFGLVWFSIYLSQVPHRAASPTVFLWILAIPLLEIGSTLVRRILRGHSPFKPDRGHIHHLLQNLGLSNLAIVLFMGAFTIILASIGILAQSLQIHSFIIFWAFVVLFIIYMFLTELLWRRLDN